MVLPGIPRQVTQRGNQRERTFFEEGDHARHGVEVWSTCLMPNHAHIVAAPRDTDGLARHLPHVDRHYTGYVNARMRVTGHLWQGRFGSVAMDEGLGRKARTDSRLFPIDLPGTFIQSRLSRQI